MLAPTNKLKKYIYMKGYNQSHRLRYTGTICGGLGAGGAKNLEAIQS